MKNPEYNTDCLESKHLKYSTFSDIPSFKRLVIGRLVEKIDDNALWFEGKLKEIAVDPLNTHFYVEDNCLIETGTGKLKLCVGTPRIPDSVKIVDMNEPFDIPGRIYRSGTCKELYIGKSLEHISGLERPFKVERIVLNVENKHFELIDGCLFYQGGTELLIRGTEGTIPRETTKISTYAFFHSDVTHITIPGSVVSIDYCAFKECNKLKTVEFEDGLQHIGFDAFDNCKIETLHLPDSLKTVENSAFSGCKRLKTITGLGSITKIPFDLFFDCSALESVVIPSTVKIIGSRAFSCCTQLRSIEIPDGVTSIEYGAFEICEKLEKVIMADSVKEMSFGVFGHCKALREVRLSNSLQTIPLEAFQECKNLREITLPPSVKKLYDECFRGCSSLKRINTDHLTRMFGEPFKGCVQLPAEMKKLSPEAEELLAEKQKQLAEKRKLRTMQQQSDPTTDKSLLPAELLSRYSFDDITGEVNVDEKIYFEKKPQSYITVIYRGILDYKDIHYLLVSKKKEQFFIEIEDEYDEKYEDYYRAKVIDKNHPLFAELKEEWEQYNDAEK